VRKFIKYWPFGQLTENQMIRFSDGTEYAVKGKGWRKVRMSDRHREHAQRKLTIF
jgi:hypothetical protein